MSKKILIQKSGNKGRGVRCSFADKRSLKIRTGHFDFCRQKSKYSTSYDKRNIFLKYAIDTTNSGQEISPARCKIYSLHCHCLRSVTNLFAPT